MCYHPNHSFVRSYGLLHVEEDSCCSDNRLMYLSDLHVNRVFD